MFFLFIAPNGKVYVHKLGYDAYRLDAIPAEVRERCEEKRRKGYEAPTGRAKRVVGL